MYNEHRGKHPSALIIDFNNDVCGCCGLCCQTMRVNKWATCIGCAGQRLTCTHSATCESGSQPGSATSCMHVDSAFFARSAPQAARRCSTTNDCEQGNASGDFEGCMCTAAASTTAGWGTAMFALPKVAACYCASISRCEPGTNERQLACSTHLTL